LSGRGKKHKTEQKRWDELSIAMASMNPGLMFIPGRTFALKLAFRRFKKEYEGSQ